MPVPTSCRVSPARAASLAPRSVLLLSALSLSLSACVLDGNDDPPVPVDAAVSISDCGIDTPETNPCAACTADQICVQFLDGVCRSESVSCMPRHPSCTGNACSQECMQWQCNGGSTSFFRRCDVGGCAADVPGALHCYGP